MTAQSDDEKKAEEYIRECEALEPMTARDRVHTRAGFLAGIAHERARMRAKIEELERRIEKERCAANIYRGELRTSYRDSQPRSECDVSSFMDRVDKEAYE